ncbi:unnamed protein product, partial [Sphacelaria rigidula]
MKFLPYTTHQSLAYILPVIFAVLATIHLLVCPSFCPNRVRREIMSCRRCSRPASSLQQVPCLPLHFTLATTRIMNPFALRQGKICVSTSSSPLLLGYLFFLAGPGLSPEISVSIIPPRPFRHADIFLARPPLSIPVYPHVLLLAHFA